MTHLSHRFSCFTFFVWIGSSYARALFTLVMMVTTVCAAFAATPTPTTTTLAISATSVPYQTPIILTATVTAGNAPITAGLVLFCEATAKFCENNSALGIAQLTFPGATASVKIGSGPIGNHSYKAVFRANNSYATSDSNIVTYSVTGTHTSSITLSSTGSIGNYSLTGTVAGFGSLNNGPTGTISFLDTSVGNNLLGSENLVVSTLSTTFVQNQPFAIGGTFPPGTKLSDERSVAIASAYLDTDNNLDVVTGDASPTISVLLGKGDGTFKPKVNYPGCSVGVAVQIVLADFNRDGVTDIALGCSDKKANGGLVINLGKGDGTFQTNPTYYPTGDVGGVAIGDFNSDGLIDIVVSDNAQQDITFFLGNGDGTFTKETAATISTPSLAHGVVVADFNMDGFDDVAYAVDTAAPNSPLSDLYVALGNGKGAFQTRTAPVASEIGEFLTTGDTNADSFPDIVSSSILRPNSGNNNVGPSLFVLLGKGDGTFHPTTTYTSDIPSDPHLADVNGDSIPDIIAGGSTGALVYQGNGDGTFQPYQEPSIGGFALTFAVNAGDYNNDGNADLIGTDADTPRAAVSLSQVQQTSVASALTNVAVFPLGSGVHNVDASYSGDSIFIGSLSSTVPLTAAPVNTSLTLTASATSAILPGQSIVLIAVLSPYTVGPPTTTTNNELVHFYTGTTLLGSGKLFNGVATITTTALPIGADSLTAVYVGDSNYDTSTSNTVTATVSNVLISSSPNPSTYTQAVTFTATVATGKTGTIAFFDGSTNIGSSAISGTEAAITTSSLTAGSHNITAQYNSNVSPVLVQVVNKATPTVTVTTSGPSTYGQSVTITASVTAGATGTITLTSGSLSLGSGTISLGSVSINTSLLTPPSDLITATYSGDDNYNSAVGTVTQTVNKVDTSGTLTSSVNPSLPGSAVTFIDTLSPTNVTGTVTFTNGSTLLGNSTINNGVASLTISTLPLGSDLITATYSGDGNNNVSTATLTQVIAKLSPAVTVSTSGPSIFGQSVSISASVPNGPTGTIVITSGGVTLGSGTITSSSGAVTITTKILPAGTDTITATYSGDATNNSATGSTTQTVNKVSPTVTLSSSVNPSVANQSVTFTAALPANVTGTVTFTAGSTILGSPALSNGVATVTTTALPTGSVTVTATYNGDSNNSTSSATLIQVISKATPVVTVTASGPSIFGSSVTIIASVPIGTTGSIAFTSGGVTLGSGTINTATGTVSISTSILPVGSDLITASYSGDANNNSATGTATQIVNKVGLTISLTSSLNPSTLNQSVTFTATLPGTATGTVTFTNGAIVLGTLTLVNGTAAVTTSSLPVGSDTITATYNGDPNNGAENTSLLQTVNKITPPVTVTTSGPSTFGGTVTITTTLPPGTTGTVTVSSGGVTLGSGNVNPTTGTVVISTTSLPVGTDPITASFGGDTSNNPATGSTTQIVTRATITVVLLSSVNPSNVNQSVTFTATILTNATGTVTFFDGSTILGTGAVSNGTAALTTSTLIAGSHPITASYGGDTNNSSASSAPLTQIVNKATPVLPPPVVSSPTLPVNTPETITETVPPGVTGTVTFSNGSTPLGSAPIVGGAATITVPSLPQGVDSITASTPGDANDNPAVSPPTAVTVGKVATLVTLISSVNPSAYNQSVTFSASVHAGATGLITFLDGTTALGTGPVSAAGVAVFATSALTIGSHPITASYGGDSNYSSAVSTILVQTVSKIPTAITIIESTPAQLVNGGITFTATVTAPNPNATGTVTFMDGSVVLGTATLTPNGGVAVSLSTNASAILLTSSLVAGSHQIVAIYSGDNTFAPSTSAPANDLVEDFTNTNTGPASQNIFPGASTTYNFSLAPITASTFLNDVTVTVTGLPAGSTYTLTPSSVAAGSGVTAMVLSVQTSAKLSAQNDQPASSPASRKGLPIALGMLGLVGIGAVRRLRNKMPRTLLLLLLMLGSLLPIAALSGCAGGYFTLNPQTYTVTVTGTEGLIQHAATATLIVQ
ncbi:beta strand repeat-containing protein [Tunturiibacter lichenicola]|uniref:beta strand repeat-containing protein n=1 Tax=Tunturiibacter lichenicola TaxID=2051959 RepID=UPI003D9AD668